MPTPDDDLNARRDALAKKLKAAQPAPPSSAPAPPKTDTTAAGMSMGLRAGSEFVAGVVVGGALGFGLDHLLHTKPLLTILFFLLGVAAGVWNVIRATSPKGDK